MRYESEEVIEENRTWRLNRIGAIQQSGRDRHHPDFNRYYRTEIDRSGHVPNAEVGEFGRACRWCGPRF